MTTGFTVFIKDLVSDGTTWIGHIDTTDVEKAKSEAMRQCAADWDRGEDFDNIDILGVAEGDIRILEWNDL
jgi:hypothetical protein